MHEGFNRFTQMSKPDRANVIASVDKMLQAAQYLRDVLQSIHHGLIVSRPPDLQKHDPLALYEYASSHAATALAAVESIFKVDEQTTAPPTQTEAAPDSAQPLSAAATPDKPPAATDRQLSGE